MGVNRLALAALCLLTAVRCGGENEPSVMSGSSTTGGSGTTAPPSGTTAGTGAGQSGSGGTTPSSTGGSPSGSGGSTATAGSGNASGGMSAAAGSGESSDDAGSMAGMMSDMFSPLCEAVPPTAAGEAPTKGGACTAEDTQLCYKTCGPQSIGFKSETCTNGAYVEQSGCTFTNMDYACFKIPEMIDASCPMTAPQSGMPCEVAECTLCNAGGNYLDSKGESKTGYCVCPVAGASGSRKWSCASTTAWPCPSGRGC